MTEAISIGDVAAFKVRDTPAFHSTHFPLIAM
jgi:hypothetical protein